MKKVVLIIVALAMTCAFTQKSYAQLDDQEYNYVTMDLRGILNLTMTTDPQVDFTFKTIQEYRNGITKFNAVQLEVDATLAWDLFVYATDDAWTQVEAYSSNGEDVLPAEILEIQCTNVDNSGSVAGVTIPTFTSLLGPTASGASGITPAATTQFLAGEVGTIAGGGSAFAPGTAADNPTTHKFRIDYRIKPSIPATFPNSVTAMPTTNGAGYAQAGYYYLEVLYVLVEDL